MEPNLAIDIRFFLSTEIKNAIKGSLENYQNSVKIELT